MIAVVVTVVVTVATVVIAVVIAVVTVVTIVTVITVTVVMTVLMTVLTERLLHPSEFLSMGFHHAQNIGTGYNQLKVPQPLHGVWVGPEGGNHERHSVALGRGHQLGDFGVKSRIFASPGRVPERQAKRGAEVPRPKHDGVDPGRLCNGIGILDSELSGLVSDFTVRLPETILTTLSIWQMTAIFLSAIVSAVQPAGAVFVMPSSKATGDRDRVPPLYAYRTFCTAALAWAAVSTSGKMTPAAPCQVSLLYSLLYMSMVNESDLPASKA